MKVAGIPRMIQLLDWLDAEIASSEQWIDANSSKDMTFYAGQRDGFVAARDKLIELAGPQRGPICQACKEPLTSVAHLLGPAMAEPVCSWSYGQAIREIERLQRLVCGPDGARHIDDAQNP